MKICRPSIFFIGIFFLFVSPVIGQNLTGIWKGYFVTETGQHYKLEFQIEQIKNKSISGVSYSYGSDINFYGKATMTGNYLRELRSFIIQEIRTVEVRNPGGGGTCIMNYRFEYAKSGKEEFLEGTYVGKTEDRNNPKNNGVWGDCGGGKVFLRRVAQSDFYLEPFLKNKPVTPKPEPQKETIKKAPTVTKTTKPPTIKPKQDNTTTKTEPVRPRPKLETIDTKPNQQVVIDNKPVERRIPSTPITTRERTNELTKTVSVNNKEIEIRLYDNGEIDDDTVSIYLDGKLILANKRLSNKPILYKIKLDEANPEHTLVMVAENLGRIPPNTSLLIVQDGDNRHQVSITSTEQKNAMVRFRYQKAQ